MAAASPLPAPTGTAVDVKAEGEECAVPWRLPLTGGDRPVMPSALLLFPFIPPSER